jgi:uridine kinase
VKLAAYLVGIAGGSGSGKTTLASALLRALAPGQAVVIPHDAYYRDLSHLAREDRSRHNFDEPAALDNDGLISDLQNLRAGRSIEQPSYDFSTHTRRAATTVVSPAPLVLVEGILVLAVPDLRALFDFKVFVATGESTRLERRIARDCHERGRTPSSVVAQFTEVTSPMHHRHVEPCREHADLVVSGEVSHAQTVATLVSLLADKIGI